MLLLHPDVRGVLLMHGLIWRLVVIGLLPAAFVTDFSWVRTSASSGNFADLRTRYDSHSVGTARDCHFTTGPLPPPYFVPFGAGHT